MIQYISLYGKQFEIIFVSTKKKCMIYNPTHDLLTHFSLKLVLSYTTSSYLIIKIIFKMCLYKNTHKNLPSTDDTVGSQDGINNDLVIISAADFGRVKGITE